MSHVVTHVGGLISGLRSARSRIDSCLMERGNPAKVYQEVSQIMEQMGGEIGELRPYAAGLGELWDTMQSVMRLAGEAYAAGGQYAGDEEDESVSGGGSRPIPTHDPARSRMGDLPDDTDTIDPTD